MVEFNHFKSRAGLPCFVLSTTDREERPVELNAVAKRQNEAWREVSGILWDASTDDALRRKMFCYAIKAIKGIDLSKTKVPPFMRRITVSEAAALQGFPKDFEFCGSQCDKYKQIGNSVPPPFAYAIAREVMSCL